MRTKTLFKLAVGCYILTGVVLLMCLWMGSLAHLRGLAIPALFLMVPLGTLGSYFWERYQKRLRGRAERERRR